MLNRFHNVSVNGETHSNGTTPYLRDIWYIPQTDSRTPWSGGFTSYQAAQDALREVERGKDAADLPCDVSREEVERLVGEADGGESWRQPLTHICLHADMGCQSSYDHDQLGAMAAKVISLFWALGEELRDSVDLRIGFHPQAQAYFGKEADRETDHWTSATFTLEGEVENVLAAARACGSDIRWYGPNRQSSVRPYQTADEAVEAHRLALPDEGGVVAVTPARQPKR